MGDQAQCSRNSRLKQPEREPQAARQQLSNPLRGVPLSIWYDWKNDGADPNEREHNFATVTHELKPKLTYIAVQTLTRELSGYRIVRRLAVRSEKDYVLLCVNSRGDQKLAAWTAGEPRTVKLEAKIKSNQRITAVKRTGRSETPKTERTHLLRDFDASPKYVSLGK